MTSRVGPRVRHSRGMRSFPRGVPRKFKRRDHPTLLSRGDKCMYVYSWYAIFFFFSFTHYPLLSRVERDGLESMPNDSPIAGRRRPKLLLPKREFHSRISGVRGISIDAILLG